MSSTVPAGVASADAATLERRGWLRWASTRLWGMPLAAWLPVVALFCLSNYRPFLGQMTGDDEPSQQINVAIIISRLKHLHIVGAAHVLGLVGEPPLRYLLALPGQAAFPHTVWGPRLGSLVFSAVMTYAFIQLGREVAGDVAGYVTGLFVAATAIYTITSVSYAWSVMLFGFVQALRALRGPLDLRDAEARRRFYRVQLWLGLAFLASTSALSFVGASLLIYAVANARHGARLIARTFAAPIGGYALYHLVFWVVIPLLGSSVYGKTHPFGQYGHTFSRNGAAVLGYSSFLSDLRSANAYLLPFVSWAMLAAALVFLWRRERVTLAFVLPHLFLWGFYFGSGTEEYFVVGVVLVVPYAVALALEAARPRNVLVAGAVVATLAAAWTTYGFTRTYARQAYPPRLFHVFYAQAHLTRNIVEPLSAIARDVDRYLPAGAQYVDDIDHAFVEYYANHDLANLGYGDPRDAGQLGTSAAPVSQADGGACWKVHPSSLRIAIVITARRLCAGQSTRTISYPDSPIRLYVLRRAAA